MYYFVSTLTVASFADFILLQLRYYIHIYTLLLKLEAENKVKIFKKLDKTIILTYLHVYSDTSDDMIFDSRKYFVSMDFLPSFSFNSFGYV